MNLQEKYGLFSNEELASLSSFDIKLEQAEELPILGAAAGGPEVGGALAGAPELLAHPLAGPVV